jgi:peptide/nickel transport system substrate-binding protein
LFSLRHRSIATVALIAAVGVYAPACGRSKQDVAPVRMRIGVGAPPKGVQGTGAASLVTNLTNETWLTSRPDGKQAERILSDWHWDRTQTKLTVRIRNDVYFHDGTRLDANIAAAVLRTTAKNFRQENVLSFESISSVQPTSPDTLELQLTEPNAFLVPDLALVAVRKEGKPSVGAGPFRPTLNNAQILTAFDKYYRGRPSLSQIEVVNYPTQRGAWAGLMRGDVDMLYEVSRDAAEFVESETAIKTYTFPRPYYIPLVFNVRHPILKRPEVRRAINEALDKAALVRDGLNGRGRIADGPVWPEHWAQSNANPTFAFGPEGARRRLDAAGFKEGAGKGEGQFRFSFTCLVFADDARFERLAVLVQRELADVGIDMKLRPLNQDELTTRVFKGDFDAFLFEFYGRSLSYAYEFWHSHDTPLANTGYTAADSVLDRMKTAKSEDEMRAGVAQLARVLYDDPPAAFIAWQQASRAVSTRFDVKPERDRDILSNVWQWRLAQPPAQASR